jgi:phosphoglycolate phosphatase
MRKRLILLDLDGPLLDPSWRYHRLHMELVGGKGGRPLSRQGYWALKRDRVPEAAILARTGLDEEAAAWVDAERLKRVETQSYLDLDRPWPWTLEVLRELSRMAPVILVTQRSRTDLLRVQLQRTGIGRHLSQVLCGEGDGTIEAKARMVEDAELSPAPDSVFIGDTEHDITSAKALHVLSVGLLCGIRADTLLEACHPDALLEDLREVPDWLVTRGFPVVPRR